MTTLRRLAPGHGLLQTRKLPPDSFRGGLRAAATGRQGQRRPGPRGFKLRHLHAEPARDPLIGKCAPPYLGESELEAAAYSAADSGDQDVTLAAANPRRKDVGSVDF